MARADISEVEFRDIFFEYMLQDNMDLFYEVPVFSRSVDLVQYDDKRNIITAIELKLSNWKKALEQLANIEICFDYLTLCIIMPSTKEGQDRIKTNCEEKGVGLYFYNLTNERFTCELQPSRVSKQWELQKQSIIRYLEGIEDHGCIKASTI